MALTCHFHQCAIWNSGHWHDRFFCSTSLTIWKRDSLTYLLYVQISRSTLGSKKLRIHTCLYRGHRVRFELIETIYWLCRKSYPNRSRLVLCSIQSDKVYIPYLTGCYIIPTYSKCLYSALTNIKTNLNCVPCGSKIDKICWTSFRLTFSPLSTHFCHIEGNNVSFVCEVRPLSEHHRWYYAFKVIQTNHVPMICKSWKWSSDKISFRFNKIVFCLNELLFHVNEIVIRAHKIIILFTQNKNSSEQNKNSFKRNNNLFKQNNNSSERNNNSFKRNKKNFHHVPSGLP